SRRSAWPTSRPIRWSRCSPAWTSSWAASWSASRNCAARFSRRSAGWLPFWLDRMDEHYEWREPYGEMTHLTAKPSEYFRRQGFCACECDEEFVAHVVAAVGDDNIVTTTDYSHGDSKYPKAMDRFFALPLSDKSKQKILCANAVRLYALLRPINVHVA